MPEWIVAILAKWTMMPEERSMIRKECGCVIEISEPRVMTELVLLLIRFEQEIHPTAHADEN